MIDMKKYIEAGKRHCTDKSDISINELEAIRRNSNDLYDAIVNDFYLGYERAYRARK